ncbi:MAG TPA: SEL1-like repeat protein [Candidatus Obscuribacterales bacterium]
MNRDLGIQAAATAWTCLAVCLIMALPATSAGTDSVDFEKGHAALIKGDYATALQYLKPLAEKGNRQAEANLAEMYEFGYGVPQNHQEALRWYRSAAQLGQGSKLSVELMYPSGHYKKSSIAELEAAAQNGYVDALWVLGVRYFRGGNGVPRDFKQAAFYFKQAADKGQVQAANDLGFCYQHGAGVDQDYAKAAVLYQKAADAGLPEAQNNLGYLYVQGKGVPRDDAKAVALFRSSAEAHDSDAQSNLGWMYQNGRGVEKDMDQAMQWYHRASAHGSPAAQYNLGYLYQTGTGVPKSFEKASELYQLAAINGVPGAQSDLGFMYEHGNGVPKDYESALKWYKKAAAARAAATMQWDIMETPSIR